MKEDGIAFDIMLAALRRIARNEADPGIEARSALRQLGEEWKFDPQASPRLETFEDGIRADEEREIVADIAAEEELEGWDQSEEDDAELYGLDRESYDALMYALEKDD